MFLNYNNLRLAHTNTNEGTHIVDQVNLSGLELKIVRLDIPKIVFQIYKSNHS